MFLAVKGVKIMGKTIAYQIDQALENSFIKGGSKRSYRAEHGDTGDKIFYGPSKTDLHKTAKIFGRWLKEAHPDVRLVRDIQPQYLQEFVDSRVGQVSPARLRTDASNVRKICRCCDAKYHTKLSAAPVVVPAAPADTAVRTRSMDRQQALDVIARLQAGRGDTWKAVTVSLCTGLRETEACNLHAGHVHLDGGEYGYGYVNVTREDRPKHGRERTVHLISAEDRDLLAQLIRGLQPGDVIAAHGGKVYRSGSVARAIGRVCPGEMAQNRLHAIRKGFAQKCYDLVRAETSGRGQAASRGAALAFVNRQLGHGRSNDAVLNARYVADQW